MMEVICRFCEKEADYAPLPEMEEYNIKIFYCKKCQAEYVFYESGKLANYSLYVTINDKLYRWAVTVGGAHARMSYVEYPGIPGFKRNQGLQTLATFGTCGQNGNQIPDITPSNIPQKLRTYLVML